MRNSLPAICLFLGLCISQPVAHGVEIPGPDLFQNGDRVVFAGDSITQGGMWHVFIVDYYLTRFPDKYIFFSNAGVGGDSAKSVIRRFDRDVLRDQPNRAVLMLGMNDVGRDYFVENPSQSQLRAQDGALAIYRTNMTQLIDMFAAKHIPLTLVTPSPFDETARIPASNNPGKNGALARAGDFLRTIAAERHLPLVDFQKPMTELNLQLQKSDPSATLCGKDRVHPGNNGHLVMATLFLKAQKAPAEVASVQIHLPDLAIAEANNCQLFGLKREGDGLKFDYMPKALPFPLSTNLQATAALVDFNQSLNREILQVKGLPEQKFILVIDGVKVGVFGAAELAKGINMAVLDTPMRRAAERIVELNHKRGGLDFQLRSLEWFGIQLDHFGISRGDLAAVKARREELITSSQAKPSMPYFQQQLDSYLVEKTKEATTKTTISNLTAAIATLCQTTNIFHAELRKGVE